MFTLLPTPPRANARSKTHEWMNDDAIVTPEGKQNSCSFISHTQVRIYELFYLVWMISRELKEFSEVLGMHWALFIEF